MLSTILVVVPWVLTVAVLLVIMFRNMQFEEEEEFDLEDEEDYDEYDREEITVAVYNDKAYWVHKNVFYESDTIKEPDFTTARPIDTMDISSKKLNELLVILDELREYRKD